MPLPKPHKNEAEQDFVSRCIATVVGDGTVDNTEAGRAQAAAMCFDQWRNRNKPKQFRDTVMNRAYSFLEIKSINEDLTDYRGNCLDANRRPNWRCCGAEWALSLILPMPLLWQHRSDEPIGHVVAAKATDRGYSIHRASCQDRCARQA